MDDLIIKSTAVTLSSYVAEDGQREISVQNIWSAWATVSVLTSGLNGRVYPSSLANSSPVTGYIVCKRQYLSLARIQTKQRDISSRNSAMYGEQLLWFSVLAFLDCSKK